MKKISMFVLVLIALAFLSANAVFADSNSYTIAVSCTIPEIPGVNAPALLEKETLEPNRIQAVQKKEEPQTENPEPSFATILDEKIKEIRETDLPQDKSSLMLTRTIYSR